MDTSIMYAISYGLYIVSASADNTLAGCTVNSVFQISADPVKIAVSLSHDNYTTACIQNTREFSVSVLTKSAPLELIGKFGFNSSREMSKFSGYNYRLLVNNLPVLTDYTSVWLHCKVENVVDIGTHVLFVAEVIDGERISDEESMTYAYYRKSLKGTTPKKAPSYQEEQSTDDDEYICEVCGYIYKGSDFENLPDDWVCPLCGVKKDRFRKK